MLRSDFRLICATHRDLDAMVEADTFRRDLYHRISTFPIRVPSLAERREDIPLLADSLLQRVSGGRRRRFSEAATDCLRTRSYPGNIRELRNVVERAVILSDSEEIGASHLGAEDTAVAVAAPATDAFVVDQPVSLRELERRYTAWLDDRVRGDRGALARQMGVGMRTVYRKLQRAQGRAAAGREQNVKD